MTQSTPNTQGASWRDDFKRNVAQLHRKTDYAGEKLPRGAFGYRTEVDWDAVEEFIEQKVASKERAEGYEEGQNSCIAQAMLSEQTMWFEEGERRGAEKAVHHVKSQYRWVGGVEKPEILIKIEEWLEEARTLPADSTEGV